MNLTAYRHHKLLLNIQSILVFVLAMALSACATNRVSTDYQAAYDFSAINQFAWLASSSKTAIGLDQQRIETAITAYFSNKNLSLADGEAESNTQLFIAFRIDNKVVPELRQINTGMIYDPWWGWTSVSTNVSTETEKHTLVLEFINHQQQVVWQGAQQVRLHERLKPEQRVKLLEQAVIAILDAFPTFNTEPQ